MKKRLRLIPALLVMIMLIVSAVPAGSLADVEENIQDGIAIRDVGSEYFYMQGQSQNQNVIANIAWRYGDYVYFGLDCQKTVTVNVNEFRINDVIIGSDNFWLLKDETGHNDIPIRIYEGKSDAEPDVFYAGDGSQPRIWIVARILISDSSLALTFENLHNAHGWEIAGVTFDVALRVSHKYGDNDPILDFDQSKSVLTVGQQITVHRVDKQGYEYTGVTVSPGFSDISINRETGEVSFTVTQAMIDAGTIDIQYTYEPIHYTLTYASTVNGAWYKPENDPAAVTGLESGASVDLAAPLTTTKDYAVSTATSDHVPGSWAFTGWKNDGGNIITKVENIDSNVTVYGEWTFTPDTYEVTYVVNEDPVWGKPEDSVTPTDSNVYNYNDPVTVAAKPATTQGYAMQGTTQVPGTWTFSDWTSAQEGFNASGFNITEDTTITGSWTFTPTTYTVTYVVNEDPVWGKPEDSGTPTDSTVYNYNDPVTVAAKPATTQGYAMQGTTQVPGTWT
ncbi:MAG: hypothetical protein J6S47_05745, partial [Eubacteriaceae bacterium]|nr:hypothetical protein [Eubacteriaceae bacterium]